MSTKIKNRVVSAFKMHGLTLKSDASKYLVDVLSQVNEVQREDAVDKLLEAIQKQSLKSSLISRAVCESAVQECNQEDEDESDVFSVIDAFTVPRFVYSNDRKKFIAESEVNSNPVCLHGNALSKGDFFRNKYSVLLQRTSRHDLFTPSAVGVTDQEKKFELKPVEYLLGSTTKLGEIIVLGMLTQLKEGKWFLEDPTGAVLLDLSAANFHSGLFTENCFVLAEGTYEDGIFHVTAFGFPPPEPAKTTRAYFGNINFFGGNSAISVKASTKLRQIEAESEDAMFVFLSDVWLDNIKVMEKLQVLFTGYSEMPPTCMVFCGNFISAPSAANHVKVMRELFDKLADLLSKYDHLVQNTKFLFIPGPHDLGPGNILPRPSLPSIVTESFQDRIPTAIFGSNPCRLQYCTQELVVFREDIVTKMCRNCVRFPSDGDVPTHFAKTIISQAHLCPLPLHVSPVYWTHDHSLRCYPLPDLIVCADKFDPFSVTNLDCTVMNPGSFPRNDFSFKVYYPSSRQTEESKITE